MEGSPRSMSANSLGSPHGAGAGSPRANVVPLSPGPRGAPAAGPLAARLAVYDSETAPPLVYDVSARDPGELLAELSARAVWLLARQADPLPREAVLAVVENLIHASFQAAAVCLLPDGSLRVCDQGPGIPDKARALLPGFTTATAEMRRYIRGVGSGLPLASLLMQRRGGSLTVEDNLGRGTVVTLSPRPACPSCPTPVPPAAAARPARAPARRVVTGSLFGESTSPLTERQAQVLALVARRGPLGPSSVSRCLGIGLSTAFRELTALEALGLLVPDASGKRKVTPQGEALAATVPATGGSAGMAKLPWN